MSNVKDIDKKIKDRSAKVFTAAEFKQIVRDGGHPTLEDVDVVTCGTFGVMSGTLAVFTVPVAGLTEIGKADTIKINGIEGSVGPCPNESLGVVDCIVNGTSHRDHDYGGGHLFRDLVAGLPVSVEATSKEGVFRKTLTLDDFAFARIIITRGGFKNYTAFANPSDSVYTTIFSDTLGLAGNLTEASVSGCGEINPLENDHASRFIRNGATILINGAVGTVMGPGTRSSESKPNLSAFADMKGMDARMMGGFRTSRGPECLTSLATAIPVADLEALEAVSILDEDTVLPIADVHDRKPLFKGRYSQIWKGDNLDVTSDLDSCLHCGTCIADELCPLGASPSSGTEGNVLCMNCGLCVSTCVGGIFECDLGSIDYGGTNVPIKVRQSDRRRGEELCVRVKRLVEEGKWNLGNGQWESTP